MLFFRIITLGLILLGSHVHSVEKPDVTDKFEGRIKAEANGMSDDEIIEREIKLRLQEYIPVSNKAVAHYLLDSFSPNFVAFDPLKSSFGLTLSALPKDPSLAYKGVVAGAGTAGKTASITRVYTLDKDKTLSIEELDHLGNGMKIKHDERFVNTSINGHPATISFSKSPDGNGVFMLSWVSEDRLTNIAMAGGNLVRDNEKLLLALATSLTYNR